MILSRFNNLENSLLQTSSDTDIQLIFYSKKKQRLTTVREKNAVLSFHQDSSSCVHIEADGASE